uniref:MARVEL domain-containing protein n=1 Tax=Salmo trutta TaxID=8032 RepID=A0A674ETP4_SALTR
MICYDLWVARRSRMSITRYNSRERDRTQDRGSSSHEERDRERQREREWQKRDKMDERYRDEKGSGDDREKDYSDRHCFHCYHPGHNRQALYNLRYALTARGLCQIMEVFVSLLVVICSGVSYSNSGGYRDLASLGGLYQYYYGGAQAFTGADRVKELDKLFHQLKLPPYIFSMACGGALMVYACIILALRILRVPYRWPPVLLGEALLQETYDNPCTEREALYKSKGHQGFACALNGADIAGGLFGGAWNHCFHLWNGLAFRAFRAVREMETESDGRW